MVGVFDSGVGGLSVLREIVKILPGEEYIYYADNANCPYGDKSREFVIDRAEKITEFLVRKGAEIIVVACNTATAAAIATLRAKYSGGLVECKSAGTSESAGARERVLKFTDGRQDHIMFIGMEPAIRPAAKLTKTGVVGVLATAGTLNGAKYHNTKELYAENVKVVEHVGVGFVEMVETGTVDEEVVAASVRPLLDAGADTIVLGCTHYPFLREVIGKVVAAIAPGREVHVIDPAPSVAKHLADVMRSEGLLKEHPDAGSTSPSATAALAAPNISLHASGDDTILRKLCNEIF